MANSTHPNTVTEDHVASSSDLHRLVASHPKNNNDRASERRIRLNSLYGKDAPRDHFTPTSVSPKTPGASSAHSLGLKAYSMNESPNESTDSEKAVKGSDSGSPDDGQVMSQKATIKELAARIPNDSSDEMFRRGEEVRAFQCNYFSLISKLE